ncbi:unnamed protein product [Heterobilharzia americana]|nr:unnamed protein product [Heterobilharzia americana]
MSSLFHTKLHELFSCDVLDSCFCKDIFLEQVVYFLQTSSLTSKLITLAEECSSIEVASTVNLYHTLDDDNDLLRLLCLLINLSSDLNNELAVYLGSFCDSSLETLVNDNKMFSEIQCIVTSLLRSFDARSLLQPLWHSYLCLELESAEADTEESNIFSSVICSNVTDRKMQVLSLARNLTRNNSLVSWNNLYRHLCVPYLKEALLYRTKLLCSENYSEHFLSSIIKYKNYILKKVLVPRLFPRRSDIREISAELSDEIVYEAFYSVRKPDMFSLIIEYPDSMAALMDLGKCLDHLPVRQDLITYLKEEVQQRLLHQDIVCKPVSACLRQREDAVRCIVDKFISSAADDEVKAEEYANTSVELHRDLLLPKPLEVEPLDAGEDSDADIVSEDPPFDSDEPTTNSDKHFIWESDWKPDPIEALYQRGSWRRKMDLLSMLVSIYGSKKAFLVEYKQLLSQRLLKQRSFHTSLEIRNLELLKLRFGEQNLHECEVMIKDIRDSKRIANLVSEAVSINFKGKQTDKLNSPTSNVIASSSAIAVVVSSSASTTSSPIVSSNTVNPTDKRITFPLSAYILSIHYWPELLDDKFKLPEDFLPVFENYEQCFERFKGNRTLNWMHKLGLVNIDVTLGKRSLKLDVTPLQVSIIHLFTKRRSWHIRDLAQELETQISNIRTSLYIFIQLGFLRHGNSQNADLVHANENAEIYEVCDEPDASSEKPNGSNSSNLSNDSEKVYSGVIETANNWLFSSEDHADSLVASIRDRKEKEFQVFWSYITAMLTNLGSLSLDRIHSMLRMFALGSTSSLEFSKDELRRFLDRKIREGQLGCDGDTYKLISSDL